MKKFSKIFLALVVGVGMTFASCMKENTGGDNPDGPEAGNGYVSFKIRATAAPDSKAPGDTEVGTANENIITNALVVLYNPTSMTVKYQFPYSFTSNGTGPITGGSDVLAGSTSAYFQLNAREVTEIAYKLVVILNPNAAVTTATEVGKAYSVFADVATATAADLTGAAKNNFMMTNFQGLVDVPVAAVKATAALANAAPVGVWVDRTMAKVVVDGAAASTKATISGQVWKLDVLNTKMYWMRRLANMNDGTAEVVEPYPAAVGAALPSVDRGKLYAEDPNMWGYSPDLYSTNNAVYGGASPLASPFTRVVNTEVTNAWASAEYCLENTMRAAEQFLDVTTSVVVKLKYAPTTSSVAFAPAAAKPIGNTPYFVYAGFVFHPTDLDAIAATGLDLVAYPTLGALQALLNTTSSGIAGFTTWVNYAAMQSASKLVATGLQFNFDGINYYRIPIRHYEDFYQGSPMAWGRFGVVRNNVYKVHINNVNNPGNFEIPEPDGPDEPGNAWLSVQIDILRWVIREQGVDL